LSIVLEINGLKKNYKTVKALKDLNVKVESGTVFGILGPNGSGKTTTLGIVLGILNPTAGDYSWFQNGQADENRKRIGALLETPNFFPYLDAVKNLRIVAQVKGMDPLVVESRIEDVLKIVNMWSRKDNKFKSFSLGMKQRLAIGSALLNDPEVLVLDEPTNGLDPQGIAEIRALIKDIASKGKTIIIASHQLDEIEKVCTDVLILKEGVTIRQSKLDELMVEKKEVAVSAADMDKLQAVAESSDLVTACRIKENLAFVEINESVSAADVNKMFYEAGVVLTELRLSKKSLEDQFLEIIG
jgi:ABC-type multidrug transport system ATPase subunit